MKVLRWVLVSVAVLTAIGVVFRFVSGDRELTCEERGARVPELEHVA